MIDPTDKTIDTRDIEPAIREATEAIPENAWLYRDEYVLEKEELEAMDKLNQEGIADFGAEWAYGMTLIADWYFEDYARDLASEIGYYDEDGMLSSYIDWERWANDVQMDYISIEFNGNVFWGRA